MLLKNFTRTSYKVDVKVEGLSCREGKLRLIAAHCGSLRLTAASHAGGALGERPFPIYIKNPPFLRFRFPTNRIAKFVEAKRFGGRLFGHGRLMGGKEARGQWAGERGHVI